MVKTSPLKENYLPHDYSTRERKEIKKVIRDMGYEGYGIYWAIMEFMHRDELMIGEESLVINENYTEKVTKVLNDYKLFYVEDDYYVSDRVLENIEYLEKKSGQATDAVNTRWLLSDFGKEYEKIFGQKPILSQEEIASLKDYAKQIPDLRKKFASIFATLQSIKFDTKTAFTPRANWLLKENNLLQVLNGQYGKLKTSVPDKEKKEAQERVEKMTTEREAVSNTAEAIAYAVKYATKRDMQTSDKAIEFMEKWDFTIEEFMEAGGKDA